MASNIFGRYVWLINILSPNKRLTFDEINDLWKKSGLSYGEGDDLPLRTFHNHRNAIKDIFGVDIECDTKGKYVYYIDNPELLKNDALHRWLIDSYATLDQIQTDSKLMKLKGRIQYEANPSGEAFLSSIIEAMRGDSVIEITYQSFDKEQTYTFEIEPYAVKVFNRRWYVIANCCTYDAIRTYGLDRIIKVKSTDKKFKMANDFDLEGYFEGCCGIMSNQSIPIQKVVVKVYDYARPYVETLPIHCSQKEIRRDADSITFEYQVRPTFDFLQHLLLQADKVEVVEPQWVRDEMHRYAENILSYYKKDKKRKK